MMTFEEWLLKKQKMGWWYFANNIKDKLHYYMEFNKYRSRTARFHAEIELHEEKAPSAKGAL